MMMIGLSSPIISYAADIFIEPMAGSTFIVDDNARLTNLDIETAAASMNYAKAEMNYLTDKSQLKFTPEVQFNRFSEDIGLDAENYFLDVFGSLFLTPQLQFAVSVDADNRVIGQGQEVNVSGISFEQATREGLSVSPSITYTFKELHQISAYYYKQNIDFSGSTATFSLQGYDYDQFGLNYNYQFSEKLNLGFSYTNSTFTPATSETDSESFKLTSNYQFNETTLLFAEYGFNESNSSSLLQNQFGLFRINAKTDGQIFKIGFEKQFNTVKFDGDYSRTVSPGSLGDQNIRDEFNLNASKRFTEKFLAKFEMELIDNTTENSLLSRSFRNFESSLFRGSLVYSLTDDLKLSGGYRYRDVLRGNDQTIRDSNRIFFKINYSFDRITI